MANLVKDLGSGAEVPILGEELLARLSWKTTTGGKKGLGGKLAAAKEIDLDEQAVLYGDDGPKDLCYHGNRDPIGNGSIVLGKDAGSGGGFGALKRLARKTENQVSVEEIQVMLSSLPPWVSSFVLLASAFQDDVKITDAESVSLTITDGQQEVFFKPTITDAGNTCLMARVFRTNGGWSIRKVNRMVTARSKAAMLNAASGV